MYLVDIGQLYRYLSSSKYWLSLIKCGVEYADCSDQDFSDEYTNGASTVMVLVGVRFKVRQFWKIGLGKASMRLWTAGMQRMSFCGACCDMKKPLSSSGDSALRQDWLKGKTVCRFGEYNRRCEELCSSELSLHFDYR